MKFEGKVQPFAVQIETAYVTIENMGEVAVSTKNIDAEELSRLCDELRADIFRRAGKPDPKVKLFAGLAT